MKLAQIRAPVCKSSSTVTFDTEVAAAARKTLINQCMGLMSVYVVQADTHTHEHTQNRTSPAVVFSLREMERHYLIAVSGSYLMRRLFPDRFRGHKLSFPSMARLRWREGAEEERGARGEEYHSISPSLLRGVFFPQNVLCEASHFCATEASQKKNHDNNNKTNK